MKFVICGKSYIAVRALTYLTDICRVHNFPITIGIIASKKDVGIDTWEPSLLGKARRLDIQVYGSLEESILDRGDIFISLECDKLINCSSLNGAKAFNIHFSELPKYRGCHTSVWPLRNGEKKTGVTLHEITDGIDDGPIIDQIVFDIPIFVNSFELFQLYNHHAYELFKNNLQTLLSMNYKSREQDHEKSTYFDRTSINYKETEIADFNMPASQVRDFIRSMTFRPYQLPLYKGRKIAYCDIIRWSGPSAETIIAGTAIIEDYCHAVVSCLDGMIRLEFDDEHS